MKPVVKTEFREVPSYITKDGSEIRELMHPSVHGNKNQSLASAVIAQGQETLLHKHINTEELYHIVSGTGLMHIDGSEFAVNPGDTVLIEPGIPHKIKNTGREPLQILCASSPPYSHSDTIILSK
ncbi:MAG: cupin domain-containing protein [Nitrospirae bacterium]|nr:cupin domain-containing protein [Nitrospirota bacterium]MBF0534207.1 cupin domain-containing protein [Nitrospirota bacterium]MBF0615879.1 cupin domain-containing protein [Nitrospirota bacterium]